MKQEMHFHEFKQLPCKSMSNDLSDVNVERQGTSAFMLLECTQSLK